MEPNIPSAFSLGWDKFRRAYPHQKHEMKLFWQLHPAISAAISTLERCQSQLRADLHLVKEKNVGVPNPYVMNSGLRIIHVIQNKNSES